METLSDQLRQYWRRLFPDDPWMNPEAALEAMAVEIEARRLLTHELILAINAQEEELAKSA